MRIHICLPVYMVDSGDRLSDFQVGPPTVLIEIF